VSPNAITLSSLAVGLAAAWCVAGSHLQTWALAVPLYMAAVVLDHADGEVARLTGRSSRFGHWLDLVVDTVVHVTLVVAMGVVAERVGFWGGNELGALSAAGVVLSAAAASLWPLDPASRGYGAGPGWLLDALGNRQGFYATLLAFVASRAMAPGLLPTLLTVMAVGSHAYWIARVTFALGFQPGRDPETAAGSAGASAASPARARADLPAESSRPAPTAGSRRVALLAIGLLPAASGVTPAAAQARFESPAALLAADLGGPPCFAPKLAATSP
jgi:phosphatidylglycerophosphate synthase